MIDRFEAIVIGGGAMGCAAIRHLAGRLGERALLLEQHRLGHDLGSSHGPSRIFRMTYAHPAYVALARQALSDWELLEREAGEVLFHRTGDLFFGPETGPLADYLRALQASGCPFERLPAAEAAARYPAFELPDDFLCLHQRDGGVLAAELCLSAQLRLARAHGGVIRDGEAAREVHRGPAGIEVVTDLGRYRTERLIVTAGGWLPDLFPELRLPLRVTRQAVGYYQPESLDDYRPDRLPVWVYVGDGQPDPTVFYGLPVFGVPGAKAARHRTDGAGLHPDTLARQTTPEEFDEVRRFLGRHLPGLADAPLVEPHVCLYGMLPEERFLIDTHPEDERVLLASPCSGHGFKFSALIGRVLAGLALDGASNVSAFEAERSLFGLRHAV